MSDNIYAKIQALAVANKEFRSMLLKTPHEALSKYLGLEISKEVPINIIEKSSWSSIEFVLPPATDRPETYSESDLQKEADPVLMCTTSVKGATCWLPSINAPTCDCKP